MLAGSNFHLFLELMNHSSQFVSIVLSAKLALEVVISVFKYLQYVTTGFRLFSFYFNAKFFSDHPSNIY